MTRLRAAVLLVAVALAALSLWRLEASRAGLVAERLAVGATPATVLRLPGAGPAPVVVIAHGFAGSRQLMAGFAETLARAGYIAVSYDLMGHGRNPVPMSGDVTSIDGTTRILMDELARVTGAALALPGADGRVAYVGHSMASDIVVRQAIRDPRVAATVGVSTFSLALTATEPANFLALAGAWEGRLAEEALAAARMADPAAEFGQTVGDPAAGTARRAALSPGVEHVGVLYSATTLGETRDWLDLTFGRESGGEVARRGGWIALLLLSVVAMAWPLAGLARGLRPAEPPARLPAGRFAAAVAVPSLAVPLVLWPLPTGFLPVLVADYLALHFLGWGAVALILARRAVRIGTGDILPALAVAGFGIGVFGWALDAQVASFVPTGGRAWIAAAIAAGAVPFLLADAVLTEGGRAPVWRVLAVRGAALGSLGLAVALDFEGLMFLLIILPVILLFYLLFGTMGGWVGRAGWRPGISGLGLGLFLAWALGVTFPLFAA